MSEDHKAASSYHTIPNDEPNLQTATYFDPSYFRTSEDDRQCRGLVQDLELRIAKVEGGTARRWTKQEVEDKARAAEKVVREKEKERLRRRAKGGNEAEDVVASEGEGA